MEKFTDQDQVNKLLNDLVIDHKSTELDLLSDELDIDLEGINLDIDVDDSDKFGNLDTHDESRHFAAAIPGINLARLVPNERSSTTISPNSIYADKRWVLESSSIKVNLIFNKKKYRNAKIIEFAKTFLYYTIPENHPTGKVKSLNTTVAYQSYLRALIVCLFDEVAIQDPARDVQHLSLDQLNRSLDKAKTISYSMYGSLFYVYSHWFTLNEYDLLPDEFKLPCERNHLLTKERRADIFDFMSSQVIGWQPFNETELTKLVEFVIPQLEKGKEKLLEITNFSDHKNLSSLEHCPRILKVVSELEDLLPIAMGSSLIPNNKPSFKTKPVQRAIKTYRQSLFAFLALITGLRRRELNALTFDDFEAISETTCRLSVTRWKTSDDPNDHGTRDDIYLPIIVYEAVTTLQKIATSFYNQKPTHLAYNHNNAEIQKKGGVSDDLIDLGQKLGINLHPHRFRKTIASLLIMQSEKNVELIRFLFGHDSYAMTMHYIMRNPFLVEDITHLMEHHYCQEFSGLLGEILSGHYSGRAAEKIAENMKNNEGQFSGEFLHTTIKEYVSAMLNAGEPLFIHRIPLGGTCVSVPVLASKPTPCTKHMNYSDRVKPDISMCEGELCPRAAFTNQSVPALIQNVKYYESILESHYSNMSDKLIQKYERLLRVTQEHVDNIQKSRPVLIKIDQVDHV